MTGSTIAHYKITAKLGEGGMGAVYRATDTKLNRDVAIKILPPAFAEDAARMQRFEREAQVLASLNHPNIAAIYGIEQGAIVMELVEGDDLRGPVPLDTAIAYARQIAAGLEAAHERGIVHRDLKPANIKVTPEGVVKLLDFGLAKATEPTAAPASPTISPTLSLTMTQAGMILGTAAYMAPEQAAGKPVDKRADIWAFGLILYELLTGERLFEGETVAHTLADVLRKDIDLAKLPADTPTVIRDLLARCLDRDPRTRLRDIGEARVLLSRPLPAAAAAAPAAPPKKPVLAWIALAAVTLLAVGEFAWQRFHPAAAPAQAVRFILPFPDGEEIPTPAGRTFVPSPDGRNIAFAAIDAHNRQQYLWIRPIDSTAARRFEKTEGANFPFWSPDSQSIGFFVEQALLRVNVSTGAVQTICEFSGGVVNRSGNGAAWSPEGVVLFGVLGGLMRIDASGGTAVPATELDTAAKEFSHAWPQFLPDGKHFLYLARADPQDQSAIYVGELGSKRRTLIVRTPTPAAFAPPGFLLFLRDSSALMAQRFDPQSLRLSGEPVPLGAEVLSNDINGRAAFAASTNGILVYRQDRDEMSMQVVWFDRAGKRLGPVTKPGVSFALRLSPDGKSAALVTRNKRGGEYLAILDLATGVMSHLNSEASRGAEWAPDSKHLFYSRASGSVFELALDTGAVTEITADQPLPRVQAVSPDGGLLLLHDESRGKTYLLTLTPPRKLQLVLDTPSRRGFFRISPDGTKVAWGGTEAAQEEVYVAEFPSFTGKRQVSGDGGGRPEWSPDGRELFYLRKSDLMAASVQPGAPVHMGMPQLLFTLNPASNTTSVFAPAGGQRFLVSELTAPHSPPQIVVVLNWQAEMKP